MSMSTDPSQVRLSPEQQRFLADLADRIGKPWSAVFDEALGQYRVEFATNGGGDRPKAVFGAGKDLVTLADDFEDSLDDFREYVE
jgi:hypothetical protein